MRRIVFPSNFFKSRLRIANYLSISSCLLISVLPRPCAGAEEKIDCGWTQGKAFSISEQRNGHLEKDYLAFGECEGENKFHWKFEGQEILSVENQNSESTVLAVFQRKGSMPQAVKMNKTWHEGSLTLSGFSNQQFRVRPLQIEVPLLGEEAWGWPARSLRSGHPSPVPPVGKFGAKRNGRRVHTGLDIPILPGEEILSPFNGQVILISYLKTQATVFLKQAGPKSRIAGIAHLKEPSVSIGQPVDRDTVIGRSMNKAEFSKTRHAYNHVHLEARTNLRDLGTASIDTHDPSQLDQTFIDPWPILEHKAK